MYSSEFFWAKKWIFSAKLIRGKHPDFCFKKNVLKQGHTEVEKQAH